MKNWKQTLLIVACLVGLHISAETLEAQTPSLWERRSPRRANLFSDVKARRPGDLLFVLINEQSDVENRDQRLMQKQNSSSSEAAGTYGVGGGLGNAAGNLNFDQESAAARSFNGNTQFRSERGFSDRFTAQVVDVLPNGNLLISGQRSVALEGDTRKLVLSGIVRAVDITPGNTISSQMVSDLNIRYVSAEDNGAEAKFINQGWLGKKFNKYWPH